MAEIRKKAWPEWFQRVASGEKNFDVRLADFDCKPGDTFVLEEWDPETKAYTGRKMTKTISYISKTKIFTMFSPQDIEKYGFMVLGLK